MPDKFVFEDKFEVQVVGFEYFDTGDVYEYDMFNVYFDYTPYDDRWNSVNRIYWTASQSGEELKLDPSSSLDYDDAAHTDDIWLSVQQNVTVRSMVQFAVNKGDTSPITIGVGQKSGEYEYFDADPTWEMTDIRHEPFELAKVENPNYNGGNVSEGSAEKYDIKVNGITEYSKIMDLDTDQKPVYLNCIGISYTITSHYGEDENPFMIFSTDCKVFQDGVSLKTTSPGQESPDYQKSQSEMPLYQDISDGQTVDFVQYYKLRTDSPIEVIFRDWQGNVILDQVLEVEPVDFN